MDENLAAGGQFEESGAESDPSSDGKLPPEPEAERSHDRGTAGSWPKVPQDWWNTDGAGRRGVNSRTSPSGPS